MIFSSFICTRILFKLINHLFNKAALSLDDGLDLRPKARTGARHLCSLHGSKPINNSLLQRLQSVVVDPVYGSLTGSPHIIIQRIAVWAAGWPHILPRQIVGAPGLSQLGRNLIISEGFCDARRQAYTAARFSNSDSIFDAIKTKLRQIVNEIPLNN